MQQPNAYVSRPIAGQPGEDTQIVNGVLAADYSMISCFVIIGVGPDAATLW